MNIINQRFIILYFAYSVFLISLISCGNLSAPSFNTTSIIFSIAWQGVFLSKNTNSLSKTDPGGPSPAKRKVDCADIGVSTIEANIYDNTDKKLAEGGPWKCNDHSGAITGSMSGSDRKIVVMGKDTNGNISYRGSVSGLTIADGETTDVGTIAVSFLDNGNGDTIAGGGITQDEMVLVKGGCFQMGDTFGGGYSNETPVHEVCVDDYYIGENEVTQGKWEAVMGTNPSYFSSCGVDCPVEKVSWNDVQEFIAALNTHTGLTYRLPTEAEWEYAARERGKDIEYSGTNSDSNIGDYAWYYSNSGSKTHPVKTKLPNALGIYDMSGNVWEWVSDRYDSSYYSISPRNNPTGPSSGSGRVFRGGSCYNLASYLRAADRYGHSPGSIELNLGFRLVRTL